MTCNCTYCTGERPDITYELRRRGQATYLYGGGGACPHCGKAAGVEMKAPVMPADEFWTCTCVDCRGTWTAKMVETKEVTSL